MKRTRLFFSLILLIVILLVIWGTNHYRRQQVDTPEVITSFYPLYYFTERISNGLVYVVNLTPAGVEPHDYEPTTQDIVQIRSSDLLILNGGRFETWAEKLQPELTAQNVQIVAVGQSLMKNNDPHVWVDPVLASQEIDLISDALIQRYPAYGEQFAANRDQLKAELTELHREFQTDLTGCHQHTIVTSHQAFDYLAARYGFNQLAIQGLNPDEEPTPQALAELTKVIEQYQIKYVFFETLVSPRLAQTLASEVGAQTLLFNPLEGLTPEERAKGIDYFSVQRENLQNLKIALECE